MAIKRSSNTIKPKSKLMKTGYEEWREPRDGEEFSKLWQHRIEEALDFRKAHTNGDDTWKRMYRNFGGDQWNDAIDTMFLSSEFPRDRITVNKCMSVVKDNLAFIIQANPKFCANPKRSEDVVSARIQGEWINELWAELELNLPTERVFADWLIIGMGVIKSGYQFKGKDDQVKSVKMDGTINYNDYIREEKPYAYRVNPRQFLWDYANACFLEESRWCCEIIFKPTNDVFANPAYSQKALNLVRTDMESPIIVAAYHKEDHSDFKKMDSDNSLEKDNDRFVLYEIWDKKYRERILYLAGVNEPLMRDPWPYDYLIEDGEGFPFEVITFTDIPNEPFPQGILQIFEDQQYELNRTRTMQYSHRRRFNRKYGVVEDSVSPEEIDKLVNGQDGTVVKMKSQNDIYPIQDAPLPSDQYNVESGISNDIRELTGSDALFSGGRLPSRTSASEISARANVQSTKLSMAINKADKFVMNLGYKILSHSRANVTTEQAILILGSLGQTWESFLASNLSSRITLKLEISTSKPYDPEMEKQQRMGVFQTITNVMPLLQQAQVAINFVEILKWTLEPFDIKDITRFFPDASVIQPTLPWMDASKQNSQGGSINPQNQARPQPPSAPNPQQSLQGQNGANGGGGLNSQNMGSLLGGG